MFLRNMQVEKQRECFQLPVGKEVEAQSSEVI